MFGIPCRSCARLEQIVRQQAAEIGQLREANLRLENERDIARHELNEQMARNRTIVQDLREAGQQRDKALSNCVKTARELTQVQIQRDQYHEQLVELVHAVDHADERIKAVVRRQFGASSERIHFKDRFIPEVLDHLCELGIWRTDDDSCYIEHDETATDDVCIEKVTDNCHNDAYVDAAENDDTDDDQVADSVFTQGVGAGNTSASNKKQRPDNAGGRNPLPDFLERRTSEYTPPEDHPALKGAVNVEIIGSRLVEQLHIEKPDLHVRALQCPIAKITLAQGIVIQQTLIPPSIIARGQASDAVLVQSAVDKVADHLPAYRQEQRLDRQGLDLPRSKLCRWHIALATFLTGVEQCIFHEISQEPVVGIDDTIHRLLVPDKHVCHNGRIWAISSQTDIYYFFTTTRESQWIADRLANFEGGVLGDAYAGHNLLLSRDDIIPLYCWAHVRRKFFDAADTQRKELMLTWIGELYGIEADIKHRTPEDRIFARNAIAAPVLERIKGLLDQWVNDSSILPQSGIGRATRYALELWPGLIQYCTMGDAPIDNNQTERGMRRVAMCRKNSLFSASEAGAEAYATLLTLIQSAMLHKLDPVSYLNDIIEDLHFGRRSCAELTPAAYSRRLQADVKIPS